MLISMHAYSHGGWSNESHLFAANHIIIHLLTRSNESLLMVHFCLALLRGESNESLKHRQTKMAVFEETQFSSENNSRLYFSEKISDVTFTYIYC